MKIFSVNEINKQIKGVLEPYFNNIIVKGEVSKFNYHSSGHLYFTIKDEESALDCAMWRSNLSKMDFKIKSGDNIIIYGKLNLFVPYGKYTFIADKIELNGIGSLQVKFEKLKEELDKAGYFDPSKKKEIPKFPKRIALITSKTSAAIEDMKRIANNRWKLTKFYIFDTLVQGEAAPTSIASNIEKADNYRFEDNKGFDLIIVARGGGSKEDLSAFNEKIVADAIFNAKTPIISAIGHEIDILISDLVADKRASTPSNAIEIALVDKNDVLFYLSSLEDKFNLLYYNILNKKSKELSSVKDLYLISSPIKKLDHKLELVNDMRDRLKSLTNNIIYNKYSKLNNMKSTFLSNHFILRFHNSISEIERLKELYKNQMQTILSYKFNQLNNLKNSFQILDPSKIERIEIIKNNKIVNLADIEEGDIFDISNFNVKITVKAMKKEKNVL